MKNGRQKQINFLVETGKFSVAGLFIPGFTVFLTLGLQIFISSIGIECSQAWTYTWTLAFIGSIISPLIFIRFIKRTTLNQESIGKRLLTFNIFEYTFLQASIASFMTSGNTLCNVGDGQNGLEFVFTGWIAIPFLVFLSFLFNQTWSMRDSQERGIADT